METAEQTHNFTIELTRKKRITTPWQIIAIFYPPRNNCTSLRTMTRRNNVASKAKNSKVVWSTDEVPATKLSFLVWGRPCRDSKTKTWKACYFHASSLVQPWRARRTNVSCGWSDVWKGPIRITMKILSDAAPPPELRVQTCCEFVLSFLIRSYPYYTIGHLDRSPIANLHGVDSTTFSCGRCKESNLFVLPFFIFSYCYCCVLMLSSACLGEGKVNSSGGMVRILNLFILFP